VNPNVTVYINNRPIGTEYPPYIVAEMSGNHNQDLSRALSIIDKAKSAGADSVKIQTYRPDTITIDHDSPEFTVRGGLWDGRRLYELYEEAHTPWEWHKPIFEHARKVGITVFSSPFDSTAVDLLESLGAPAYKIASPELIDIPLIKKVASTGKPIVMSTGMANLEEISEAIDAARQGGSSDIIVLHCTAAYPAPPNESNLVTIGEIASKFRVMVGLSDHTLGTAIPAIAVALGAVFIEKHFTLSRAEGGVDSAFSLEPAELKELVDSAKLAHAALGQPAFEPTPSEASVLNNRRSLYVVAPVKKGAVLTSENVRSIRPGKGLKPKFYEAILGRKASRDLSFGEPLTPEMIEGGLGV
jgi:pseudaminic acid synthase